MAQETKRQRQTSELVKRSFSTLLQQEGAFVYGTEVLVTVTSVKMSPDLNLAKIYLSVYNTDNKQAVILKLEEHRFRLQQSFYQRLRKHVRRVPGLSYYLDDTLDEMYRLNNLFDNLEEDSPTAELD